MKEKYFVEYSVSQRCFNIDTVNRIFETNLNSVINSIPNDYKVLTITDSYEDAQNFIQKLKKEFQDLVD